MPRATASSSEASFGAFNCRADFVCVLGQDVAVIGGGDTAMEDALVLARTSQSVTVIHRRDEFRASEVVQVKLIYIFLCAPTRVR